VPASGVVSRLVTSHGPRPGGQNTL